MVLWVLSIRCLRKMPSDEPQSEDEFLKRQSELAREGLLQLRDETIQSLRRTADLSAWTARFPWASIGTATTAGLATGWVIGRTVRGSPADAQAGAEAKDAAEQAADAASEAEDHARRAKAAAREASHPAIRLMSGLGTLVGAAASAAVASAAEGLGEALKTTLRDALVTSEPEPEATIDANGDGIDSAASSDDGR